MKKPDGKTCKREFGRSRSGGRFALVASALLALLLSACVCAEARAQGVADAPVNASPEARRELEARAGDANPAGLLRVLNLTPEQRAQIAAIRRETQPQGRLLGARLRQARRALDEAIYAANPDESVIEERVREVGAAQAAIVRLRSLTELRIRRVLSPAQLEAFRRLQRESLARRRSNRLAPPPQGDLPADAPARFRDRMQRRRQEQEQRQQQRQQQPQQPQRRLPDEENAPPSPPPAARQRRPDSSRVGRP